MAINFPDSPSLNQIFNDTTSGFSFQWDGEVWKSYVDPTIGNVTKLDDISGSFNGITTSFALTINGSAATADLDPAKVILSLGGVVQNPVDDYYITGTNLIFTTAPAASLTFFASVYETGIAKSYISSGVVSPSNLTTGGFSWNTGGDLYISGVSTISNTGTATTALYVSGNARIAGILTVGSSSITLDGTNNTIKVGTALTLSSSGVTAGIITGKLYGDGANLTGVGIGTAGSVNTSGIVTAASFYGDGSNLSNVGVGTQSSVNTTGIVTAGTFYGDGSGLTNLGGPLQPLTYSPAIGATGVYADTNIVITFNKPLKVNTGTITLRSGSASGTIIESYDVTSSSLLSINGGILTINPTDNLIGAGTTYFVVIPAAAYKDDFESSSNVGITTYSFTTATTFYELFAWGSNSNGSLGQNSLTTRSSPIQIPGVSWSQVDGYYHVIAKKTDGTLWAWGSNSSPRLGLNDLISRSSPQQIPGTQWNSISVGYTHTLATKTDGTLWTWGLNNYGYLGQNNKVYYSSPQQIPGTQWNNISASIYYSFATKTDGTLWAWGSAGSGQLGQNNRTYLSSPTQIPGTQWNKPFAGYVSSGATKTDGTLWSWGYNIRGQLGLNNTVDRSSPTQIPGTQWNNASAAYYHMLVTKTDGTLWAWGSEGDGSLGQNDNVRYSSPRQIPGTQWSLSDDRAGGYYSLARKTDGTLWTIGGRNGSGQLGQGDAIQRSSPTQIPGTQWNAVSQGYANSFAIKAVT